MPIVENIPDTTGKKCECGSWLNHWENAARRNAEYCAVVGCNETNHLVGAHVYKIEPYSPYHFIIPLCKRHNNIPPGERFEVKNVFFAWANVSGTCGAYFDEDD
ncbi:hypothetical protein [Leptospira idonii]|uniref:Uncharacterized protein n=1 Tax=Leptospira idonii TaxID=1193500 RepID=A0A4R9M5N3_9LEPT|nr:hypothetical protein [Leptospira idonii]TGN20519.1 hypothetical protein EHS15_03350 [Leptospira idonii]